MGYFSPQFFPSCEVTRWCIIPSVLSWSNSSHSSSIEPPPPPAVSHWTVGYNGHLKLINSSYYLFFWHFDVCIVVDRLLCSTFSSSRLSSFFLKGTCSNCCCFFPFFNFCRRLLDQWFKFLLNELLLYMAYYTVLSCNCRSIIQRQKR